MVAFFQLVVIPIAEAPLMPEYSSVATSLPVTIQRIAEWSQTLKDKGLVLIPISAAVHAQRQS